MTRKLALFVLALALVVAAWELYKWLGPETGGTVLGWKVLPKTSRNAMPHVWDMVHRLFETESAASERRMWVVVASAVWFSLRLAILGALLGAAIGIALAILMARVSVVRRGLLPYLIVSQTIPLIALGPLVVSWSGRLHPFGLDLPRWLPVSLLGAFLAFFPIAVGTLRGLRSTPATSLELMDSYAASWQQTLWRVRFPAAFPSMVPALRLGASAAVVGVVVTEIATGLDGGIGRLVLTFGQQASSDPEKVYTAVFGAAALGLLMAGIVGLIDAAMMRHRAPEVEAA